MVTGTSTLNAGTGDITLDQPNNDFREVVSVSGDIVNLNDRNALALGVLDTTGSVTVINAGDLDLGRGTVGGNLTASPNGGKILQSAPLAIAGITDIAAGGAAVSLGDPGNTFGGDVRVLAASLNIQTRGDLIFGTTSIAGNLDAVSASGSILQNGPMNVEAATTMQSAVEIRLMNLDNEFVDGFDGRAPSMVVAGDRQGDAARAASIAALLASTASTSALTPLAGSQVSSVVVPPVTVEPRAVVTPVAGAALPAAGSVVPSAAPVEVSLNAAGTVAPASAAVNLGSSQAATPVGESGFVAVRIFEPVRVPAGNAFAFTLPANTFQHVESQTAVQVSAATAEGAALPAWVSFSPESGRFTGVPPEGVSMLEVKVTARDANGSEVSTVLKLEFN